MTGNHFDAIIIGSGLGGLLCGNILAKEGMRVCILEKHSQAGGALQTFRRKGIEFDTGIHYIGGMEEGQNLNRYFQYFGLTGKLKLKQLNKDRFDVIAFDDAEYPLAQGYSNFIEQLLPFFPDKRPALQSYIETLRNISISFPLYNIEVPGRNHTEDIYRQQGAHGFYQSLDSVKQHRGSAIHPPSPIPHPRVPLSSVLAGNNFLYAGNKEKTPLYIPTLINHSFISSAWRLIGGSQQLANLLVNSLRDAGGEVIANAGVNRVVHSESRFTVSLTNNEKFTCGKLIAAIHPVKALELFDPGLFRKAYSERISTLENTPGSFALYAILKKDSFKYLDFNYYYHSGPKVWHVPGTGSWPDSYMLHTPAYDEKSTFAKSLVIMTYMDFSDVRKWESSFTGARHRSYYEFKEKKADQLLSLAEKKFPGLRSAIVSTETSTPLTWRDYTGTPGGSMYGILKDYNDPVVTTVMPCTKVPGFFFTGQNVNLHGALGVTVGAVMTCAEILGYDYLLNKIRND